MVTINIKTRNLVIKDNVSKSKFFIITLIFRINKIPTVIFDTDLTILQVKRSYDNN